MSNYMPPRFRLPRLGGIPAELLSAGMSRDQQPLVWATIISGEHVTGDYKFPVSLIGCHSFKASMVFC